MAYVVRNFNTSSLATFSYVSASQTTNPSTTEFYNGLASASFGNWTTRDFILNVAATGMETHLTGTFAYITGAQSPDYILSPPQASFANLMMDSMGYISLTSSMGSTGGGTTTLTRYKMRGYRPATSVYEYWITTDPNAAPPSGNPLIDVTISQVLSNT